MLEAGAPKGLIPCGLGARDTLRLEAGLRLYGQDMDDRTDPYSCALGWTVKPQKGDFIGSAALARLDPKHPPRRFAGITLEGRAIARHGQRVFAGGKDAGEVTSGTYSFTLDHSIATVSVDGDLPVDADLSIDIRGTLAAAAVVPLPFYRRPKGA
jgi:aminomethyltransferase